MTNTNARSAQAPNPLARFADEVATLAEGLRDARFRGSERYVVETDAVQRKLVDIAQRMRRAASERRAPASGGKEDARTAAETLFRPRSR